MYGNELWQNKSPAAHRRRWRGPHRGPAGAVVDDFLGRDWKIALLFVLPMVVLMVGLIFWPFINADPDQLHHALDPQDRDLASAWRTTCALWADPSSARRSTTRSCSPVASVSCKLVVGMMYRAAAQQQAAVPQRADRHHAAAVDRARSGHGDGLAQHLRPDLRRPQPDPAGARADRPATSPGWPSRSWRCPA